MKRLNAQQVKDIREGLETVIIALLAKRDRAYFHMSPEHRADARAFYEERNAVYRAILEALPARGGVELEDEPDESEEEDDA